MKHLTPTRKIFRIKFSLPTKTAIFNRLHVRELCQGMFRIYKEKSGESIYQKRKISVVCS